MAQLGNVPAINAVKEHLDRLKEINLISEWEIPYENILTKPDAAFFFLTPTAESGLEQIWSELSIHGTIQYHLNEEKKLSPLAWRVTFT